MSVMLSKQLPNSSESVVSGAKPKEEFYFQWHLTNKCNLRCAHCYQNDYSQPELSLDELKSIAKKLDYTLSRWGKEGRIGITGGEPFIRKDLFDLLEYLQQLPNIKKIGILTNGTFIKDNIQRLKRLTKLYYIQLSLEGRRETNDHIRGNGVFDKVIESTSILENANIPVRWMVTLHKKNVGDVPNIINLALEKNIDALTFERLVPVGSGKFLADYILSPEELEKTFSFIVRRSDEEFAKGSHLAILKLRTLWVLSDPQRAEKKAFTSIANEVGASCSVGVDSLCILPDATVLPCRRLPIPIGNLKTDSIFKIWL